MAACFTQISEVVVDDIFIVIMEILERKGVCSIFLGQEHVLKLIRETHGCSRRTRRRRNSRPVFSDEQRHARRLRGSCHQHVGPFDGPIFLSPKLAHAATKEPWIFQTALGSPPGGCSPVEIALTRADGRPGVLQSKPDTF
jgi:hypothetical protein